MASGISTQAKAGTLFLKALWDATSLNGNKLSRRTFLQNYWNQVSAEDLDKVTQTLTQAGMIIEDFTGNDLGYIMSKKCREKFESKAKKQTP